MLINLSNNVISQPTHGVKVQWSLDRVYIISTLMDTDAAALDKWNAVHRDILLNWPCAVPYLMMHNFLDNPSISVTPRAQAYLHHLFTLRPDLNGSIAILLPETFLSKVVARVLNTRKRGGLESKVFYDSGAAVEWLCQPAPV